MEKEIFTLNKNKIREKRNMPKGKKTTGRRWVDSIKYLANGTIDQYKVGLVT